MALLDKLLGNGIRWRGTGHLVKAQQQLHFGVDVQVRIGKGFTKLIEALVQITLVVIELRQGDARHAVVRVGSDRLFIKFERFVTLSQFLVHFGKHPIIPRVLRVRGDGLFQ